MEASDMGEVGDVARHIVRERQHEIVNGRLDGRFWFAAVMRQANDIVRRRKAWERRTS
jgi:hypothetical protein